MSFPRDWFKYDQLTLDMALYEHDIILGAERPQGEEAWPESVDLLRPDGSLSWSEAFKLSKKLFALREAIRRAMTGERKAAVPIPPGLVSFVRKVVMLRPGRPEKGLAQTTPAILVIAGTESPYRTSMKGLQLFSQTPEYQAVQEMKRAIALREVGMDTSTLPQEKQETPEERWKREREEAAKLWAEVEAEAKKSPGSGRAEASPPSTSEEEASRPATQGEGTGEDGNGIS